MVVIYYTVQILSSDLCNVLAWPVHHVLQDPCYGTKRGGQIGDEDFERGIRKASHIYSNRQIGTR